MTKKSVSLATLAVAIIAILFPPWGLRGTDFDHFGFAFRTSPKLIQYPFVEGVISWPLLGLELLLIVLAGAMAYIIVNR